MIDALVDAGFSVKVCCKVLGVSRQGYYRYRQRPMSPTMMRREWLTALITQVHAESRGTYGSRRVRGTNENTNGLLRQYLPRGQDLSNKSPGDLQQIADELNSRPRKVLDWDTPSERLNALMGP